MEECLLPKREVAGSILVARSKHDGPGRCERPGPRRLESSRHAERVEGGINEQLPTRRAHGVPVFTIPTGGLLREELAARQMTVQDLVEQARIPQVTVDEILGVRDAD